ncbi:unnamed protein product [Caenorhabditis auriculariae]|uniref:STAC3-related SH3 domain-containing protein n=1 Tax=Caenorhabditis auriculariae TaxID=2777116 RepID=A0A8S1HMV4_9PELO|nr:unnamed protein product [Caenorhabditis auriculariae]
MGVSRGNVQHLSCVFKTRVIWDDSISKLTIILLFNLQGRSQSSDGVNASNTRRATDGPREVRQLLVGDSSPPPRIVNSFLGLRSTPRHRITLVANGTRRFASSKDYIASRSRYHIGRRKENVCPEAMCSSASAPFSAVATPSAHIRRLFPRMAAGRRRMSLPQTPMGSPAGGLRMNPGLCSSARQPQRQLPQLRPNGSLFSLLHQYPPAESVLVEYDAHARLSQPELYTNSEVFRSPGYQRKAVTARSSNSSGIARKLLKRANYSDLSTRFQKTHGHSGGVGAVQSKVADVRGSANNVHDVIVDPVYLALKQATGRYTRRGSSTNLESASPSPRNLSQVSLQDSGYAEMTSAKGNPMLGSTPQLDNTGRSTGRRRAPKLSTQMKSLSLDCQDMPPRINSATRSPLRGKLAPRDFRRNGAVNGSSDFSDVERSCSPIVKSRRSSAALMQSRGYIVIHEYAPSYGAPLVLGERVHVVDNGDPDWLHGFRYNDRTEHLITFPATCVAQMHPGEQAMRILQNVFVPEQKFRMYRDQVVFAQPDTLVDGKVTVRTEHNALAPCPLSSLALI